MAGYYNKEILNQYMKEEQKNEMERQEAEKKKQAADKANFKKLAGAVEKASNHAKVAFEQTQQNRFEIEDLKRQVRKARLASLISIVIAVICAAMVMADELARMSSVLP